MSQVSAEPAPANVDAGAGSRRTWMVMVRSAGVRVLVLPVGAVVGLVITRLVITHYGEAAYGQYGLLVGIGNLLPFADLGLSAAIMNAVASAKDPSTDRDVRLTLVSVFRLLTASALLIAIAAVLITLLGGWRSILGDGLTAETGPLAAGLCLALIGLAVPVGVGQRILTGLGRNHVTIGLNALNRPLVLLVLAGLVAAGVPFGGYVSVLVYAAALVLAVAATVLAARQIRPAVGRAIRDAARLRTVAGGKVFDVAWPMLLQMVALPIAMQSDRIVISHLSVLPQLNAYNFATQLYTPIAAVTSAAGITLWSRFARERAGIDSSGTSPSRMAVIFATLSGIAVLGMSILTPVLSDLATDGRVHLSLLLMISFGVLIVARGANQPLGMYLTDAAGLRFQAIMIVIMLPLNLGLSIVLSGPLGASGPTLGSAAGVLLCQVIPNWLYVIRARRRDLNQTVGSR